MRKPVVCGQRPSAFIRLLLRQLRGFKKPVQPLEVGCNLKHFHWFDTKKMLQKFVTTAEREFVIP